MPGLLIKDLPEELHGMLRARASRNHRSLGKEALAILEASLRDPAGPPPLTAIDKLRVRGRAPLTEELLAEGRHTGRP